MILKFDLDIEDWMSFQRNVILNSKQIQLTRKLLFYGVPIFMLITAFLLNYNRSTQQIAISFGIILLFSTLWMFFQHRTFYMRLEKRYRKIIEENKRENLIGEQEIVFENDRFILRANNFETAIPYHKIIQLQKNENYIYLYLNPVTAVILPLRKINLSNGDFNTLNSLLGKIKIEK